MKPSFARTRHLVAALILVAVTAPLSFGADVWLVAKQLTKTMPDSTVITMWGFASANPGFSGVGAATVPGPRITVPPGDTTLTIHLRNDLTGPNAQPVSIVIPGQPASLNPTWTVDAQSRNRVTSFTTAAAPSGGQALYTFNGVRPGTYLYQSGTNAGVQVPMGLYGAMTKNQAAGWAYPNVPFDNEALVLFSEIDPALNAAVIGGTFGSPAYPSTVNYQAAYFLINGQPHPNAAAVLGHPIVSGERVLLRGLNAGLETHVAAVNGANLVQVSEDGNPLPYFQETHEVPLPAGKTADGVLPVGSPATFTVFDRRLALTNAGVGPGGMQTNLTVGARTADITVTTGSDDAEESAGGSVDTGNGDLELVQESSTQTVGLRFPNVMVPPGATITNAWIQFQADETTSGSILLRIDGQAALTPLTFTNANFNISSRPRTAAFVNWSPPNWTSVGAMGSAQQTTNLAAIVQELVNQGGWASGNAMAFIITGSGKRVAESREGSSSGAPALHIEYSLPAPVAIPPTTSSTTTTTSTSTTTTTLVPPITFQRRVAGSSDDAEQRVSNGSMNLSRTTLRMVDDGSGNIQLVGIRFRNITIPPGATIVNAYIQFRSGSGSPAGLVTLTLRGQAADNAGTFTSSTSNISNRSLTSASQTWSPANWPSSGVTGPDQQTTNLTAIIQEIIGRPGWSSGNALAIIVSGPSGARRATSYNGSSSGAPLLVIQYTTGGPTSTTTTTTSTTTTTTSTTTTTTAGPTTTTTTTPTTTTTSTTTTTTTTSTTTTTLTGPATIFERRVSTGSDDAEEAVSNESVNLNSSDLELVEDDNGPGIQVVGVRFQNVTIPRNATITAAWVQFKTDPTTSSGLVTVTIQGQASDNAATFTSSSGNISDRPRTSASVPWSPPDWLTPGATGFGQRTPDIKTIIQQIVNRSGWNPGQALAVILTDGAGKRVAVSYNGSSSGAPLLHVEYTP